VIQLDELNRQHREWWYQSFVALDHRRSWGNNPN